MAEVPVERVRLQLKWQHQFQFAGYYAAKAQGYYRAAGLEVEIAEAGPTIDPVREVVEGRAQYGVGNSGLLLARHQGHPVVVLAAIFQHSAFLLVARSDAGIGSLHDLVGRRVMLDLHSEELLAYLKKEGVPLERLQRQNHSFDSMDLIKGKVDALSAYSSDEPFFLEQAGYKYLSFTPRAAGIDFYGDNLFTTERELQEHPARVKAFREASLRGWKYAMAHPDELIELILTQYAQAHNREHLRFEAREMVPLIRPEMVELGYMHEGRWQHIADTYADLGLLPRPTSLAGFLYDPEAKERLIRRRLQMALALALPIALLLGILVAVFLRLNRRLRRAAQEQAELAAGLQESERRFRFIAEHSADVIWMMDIATERFTYVSPSAVQLRGFTAEEVMAKPGTEALTPESIALVRAVLGRSVTAWNAGRPVTPVVMELEQPHKDGHTVFTEVVATLHANADGQLASVLGVSRDITERRRADLRLRQEVSSLEQLASTDPLTEAWNRRHFEDSVAGEIHRAQRYGHPLSLLLLDIDHFKRINDAHGHREGDRVLRGVADCVRAAIRVSDSLTRWGGEEFLVLMPNTGLASAATLAERIREAVATWTFQGLPPVTVSLGLAEFLPTESREAWIERTDRAMYRAKQGGRNRVFLDPLRPDSSEGMADSGSTFLKLIWREAYCSGHALIDTQHEGLFRLANDLLDATLAGRPREDISSRVSSLITEVVRHFHDEEAVLAELGYPELEAHAARHGTLIAQALDMEQAFRNGAMTVGSLFQFLAQDVIAEHMLTADREYFGFTAQDGKS
jgi:diguanylate cyclase (GGDEF)-like protein/hemerythrin-like metal-binding protein/PAS domain S-box-containing protein